MDLALIPPASGTFLFIPAFIFYTLIPVAGITLFTYMIVMRLKPIVLAQPDKPIGQIPERLILLLKMWLLQWRQPRYMLAGVLHILLFAGFLILGLRSLELMFVGIKPGFSIMGDSAVGQIYAVLRSYAATWVLAVALIAMYRRAISKPARYAVPAKYGKPHTAEAVFVLGMICTLMLMEGLFEGSLVAAQVQQGMPHHVLPPLTLAWFFQLVLSSASQNVLQWLHSASYFVHDVTFFTFLCFLPLGKHFHVITSLFNVFLMRTQRGNIKPVRYGVSNDQLDELETFGVKKLEDFTWRHILHFYSCVDCGRCSDNCPANAVGRPLSPRFISIKGRNLIFAKYPLWGPSKANGDALIGTTYAEDEIWSCTTCGACEQECPVGNEYIDKIVDLRRGMVDEGMVPQSLQKPLSAIEKRGNPWGKMEKKRAEWTKALDGEVEVKVLAAGDKAEVLYFVDSITSFDDRMQSIGKATATLLHRSGADFGILGKDEKDSGHEVRRFGEEMLFQSLREHNTELIKESGATRIVTADPHALNALKNDYEGLPPVEHISQFLARQVRNGSLRFKPVENGDKVYTYHDPCYLGRHNGIYDDPRKVLDAVPGLRRVDMLRCKDRSFCCGGGGLMLFYEPEEEQRMGVLRVKMAAEAGANVIVTACPFCLVNMEDAIKTAGLEGKMEAIDLSELMAAQLAD
ncbi:MAG: (Fe-S)-binding protein [Desulfobacteraceae bacterium]|nr:MAG: (Fe-S)-binding protein [Desulfobacteraceae bacterium]